MEDRIFRWKLQNINDMEAKHEDSNVDLRQLEETDPSEKISISNTTPKTEKLIYESRRQRLSRKADRCIPSVRHHRPPRAGSTTLRGQDHYIFLTWCSSFLLLDTLSNSLSFLKAAISFGWGFGLSQSVSRLACSCRVQCNRHVCLICLPASISEAHSVLSI